MTPKYSTFPCGHDRSPLNTKMWKGRPNGCKACARAATDRYRKKNYCPKRSEPKPPLDLSGDADVQRYHLEKAKRAEKGRPELEAARTAFFALLDREKQQGRGGRPRKDGKPIQRRGAPLVVGKKRKAS